MEAVLPRVFPNLMPVGAWHRSQARQHPLDKRLQYVSGGLSHVLQQFLVVCPLLHSPRPFLLQYRSSGALHGTDLMGALSQP